jgi:hypothetical protein
LDFFSSCFVFLIAENLPIIEDKQEQALSTYKKPALVLIISVLLFAGTIFLLDFEPLDFVRTHFYNPSFLNSIVKENEKAAEIVQNHILELQDRFAGTLNEPAIQSSFLYNQTAADIFERSRVFGILMESISGLQSVQFVDSNGIRIHYSTSTRDVISQSRNSATYRNYTDDSRALPYNDINVAANENSKYTMDDSHDRIIFSFPFYDSMDVYRGTALFTLSVRALAERLITEGSLKPTDDVSVIRAPRGVVFGSPNTSKSVILEQISSVWSAGLQEYITLDAEDAGIKYALISTKTSNDLFFGRIINDSIFSIPGSMKLILHFSMFLTLFLTLYFIINFKPHPVTLVQNRIKTLRSNLFEQLYIKKTGQDRAKWILELEQRRDEIRFELKSRIRVKRALENKIDEIIDTAWDELLAVMKSGYDLASLQEIVKTRTVRIEKPKTVETDEITDSIHDDIEEAEALDEAEEIEEIDEIEEAEDIENIDEIDEIEEIGEPEKIKSYTEIQLSKGLLKAANEILAKIKKEEAKASALVRTKKGLLRRAIEFLNSKKAASTPAYIRKGLLKLALEFLKSIESKKAKETEIIEAEKSSPKGLLALASTYDKQKKQKSAALLTEHLSVREIELDNYSETDNDGQGLLFEMEVVSPFSSMFSSLEDEKESATSSMSAD